MRYELEFEVRDYECDLQGIVNNAVYQNYLEHTRHRFIKTKGIDFSKMTKEGYFLVVVRAEIDYKSSLKSGDSFKVQLTCSQESKLRIAFYQDIVRLTDHKHILSAKIITTCISDKGKPLIPDFISQIFASNAPLPPH